MKKLLERLMEGTAATAGYGAATGSGMPMGKPETTADMNSRETKVETPQPAYRDRKKFWKKRNEARMVCMSERRLTEMRDEELFNVSVITDCDAEYCAGDVGELDYGINGKCGDWLASDPGHREKLAAFLEDLARQAREGSGAFG